jgi:hypothetical protein
MRVLVDFRLMRRMHMLMAAMLSGMLMGMHVRIFCMSMLVGMLVQVLMGVRVRVLMRMDYICVKMLMAVHMGMLMRVQMFMFVLAFHDRLPLKNSPFLTEPAPDGGFQVRRWGIKAQPPAIDFHQAWKPSLDLQTCLSHLVDINGCEFHGPLVGDQTS